jgi:tetratricopeptide (TPR) repeat protein
MKDESNPQYWFELGQKNSQGGNRRTAIQCYQRAVDLDPTFNMAWSNMSAEYFHLRDYPKAISAAKAAIRANESDNLAWLNLGGSYFSTNDNGRALYCFLRARDLGNASAIEFLEKAERLHDALTQVTPIGVDLEDVGEGRTQLPAEPDLLEPETVLVKCPTCGHQMTVEKGEVETTPAVICEACGSIVEIDLSNPKA